ncbi:hypothetical protein FE257_006012 [Aspergillus nanangensis]|uniref:Uncharacterized protein n=1 Tax=Aspergillus nanangensis TaxID=2582783 RepID=A0AAD4CPL4_ASPNN|nr:hypothetical protein FE257_006012 [Aspergillus nanangensis]
MKLQTLGCSLLALATGTNACIRVQAYLHNDPYTGDTMSVQIYDGSDKICGTGDRKFAASSDTKWKFQCGDDNRYEVHLKSNGAKGYVWNHNAGWEADLIAKDSKHEVTCTYKTGVNERCAGYTSDTETVLWDGFGDCDSRYNTEKCGSAGCDLAEKDMSQETIDRLAEVTDPRINISGGPQ